MPSRVFKIKPTIQQYEWGKLGRTSKVAVFSEASGFTVDESSPYAELWMGTHVKSPSHILSSGQVLSATLAENPDLIGKRIIDKFDASTGNLPYLFKVLSIQKALSIQTHPDKQTAEVLHAQFPDIYKDPNHKPEMALAITPFDALCGFRPLPQIATFLETTPEFTALIPTSIVDTFLSIASSSNPTGPAEKKALKDLFAAVMTAEVEALNHQLEALVTRYNSGQGRISDREDAEVMDLVLNLNKEYPGDIGIFCAYMLNYVHLAPGEAIFLGAGEPHAYISGECIECMANSDNVIRAGLTPKLRDLPNLISGLTYAAALPNKHVVEPKSFSAFSTLYDPPIPEFSVIQTKLQQHNVDVQKAVAGPSIGIVTDGKGSLQWGNDDVLNLGVGDVFFVGADTKVTLASQGTELVVYRAFVEAE